jgi:hypothetical protein
MIRNILTGLLLTCTFLATAQPGAAEFAQNIHQDSLKYHLQIIASDEFEGRNSGARGERLAITYMRNYFKAHGLISPNGIAAYTQPVLLKTEKKTQTDLSINGQSLTYPVQYIIPVTDNRNGSFTSNEIVFAGYGIEHKLYNDYKGLNVRGKTVVIILDEPRSEDGNYLLTQSKQNSEWGTFRSLEKKLALALKKGVAGALILSPHQKSFTEGVISNAEQSRMFIHQPPVSKSLNYAVLSLDFVKAHFETIGQEWLQAIETRRPFEKKEHVTLKQSVQFNFVKETVLLPSANVAAVIEGTDKKDEFVFISAHYDHVGMKNGEIYNGADDDGSGTVAIMEIGKAFAKAKAAGYGPRRTIVILAFTAEEKGLLGSRYFSEAPFVSMDNISAALNIDMIGRIDTERTTSDTLNYVYVVGHNKLSSDLKTITETINQKYVGLTTDYKFDAPDDRHRIYYRSDHYHFARKGVPVLFFYDGMLKADYHKPTDTYEKINYSLYEKRARLIFHIAWEIANRDEMLLRDIPLPSSAR